MADGSRQVGRAVRGDGRRARHDGSAHHQHRMIRGTLQRLAKMESEELRFRLLCEIRKATGRLATTLSRPEWDRASLLALLEEGDRTPAWPSLRTALKRGDHHQAHR